MSFHATKVFHTIEGGALVVDDGALYERLRLLRNCGINGDKRVVYAGVNARMNELEAAMGLCNLDAVDERIGRRKGIYDYYRRTLADTGLKFQDVIASRHNYSYMPVCFSNSEERNGVYEKLAGNGIRPRKNYPPLTPDFKYFRNDGALRERSDDFDRGGHNHAFLRA